MVRGHRGRARLGCLFSALILVTLIYFGVNIGEVYLRYYRFRDGMEQEARFARTFSDVEIRSRLRALADSLGLPDDAGAFSIQRSANVIRISTEYSEHVELPLFTRALHFAPSVERSF
jgi:hypothetical protein